MTDRQDAVKLDIAATVASQKPPASAAAMSSSSGLSDRQLKYISLITLTGQNAILGLSMRYSRTREGDLFINTTAVATAEVVKLLTCLFLVYRDEKYSATRWKKALYDTIVVNKIDTLKVSLI